MVNPLIRSGHLMLPFLSLFILFCFTTLWNTVHAAEIAIVKSAALPYYDHAILGFKAGLPSMTKVKGKRFVLPLVDLKASDPQSPNYQLLHDYTVWVKNWRR
jgi:hypothetical protein